MGLMRYWMGVESKSAQTGKVETREVGPYVASIEGCCHFEVTEEMVRVHVRKMHHGEEPVRIEPVPKRTKKGKTNEQ